MNEVIAGTLASHRFAMILLDAFAVVALLLASLGLYGVISYLVGERKHELGIRLALGAQRSHVLRLVLGSGMKMAWLECAGIVAAFGLTRLLSSMLFGVSATDPIRLRSLRCTVSWLSSPAICRRRATKSIRW